jgi:serine/threonine protein kinase
MGGVVKVVALGSPVAGSSSAATPTTPASTGKATHSNSTPTPKPSSPKTGGAATPGSGPLKEVRSGKVSLDDFELLRVVGRGSYGKVLAVRAKRTGEVLALKVLAKSRVVARHQVEHTQAERAILETIDHPFLVKLRAAFQTPTKLYLVLPFLRGGEVFHHLKARKRFDEALARFYMAEVILGMGHLHELGIVYRDLKVRHCCYTSPLSTIPMLLIVIFTIAARERAPGRVRPRAPDRLWVEQSPTWP